MDESIQGSWSGEDGRPPAHVSLWLMLVLGPAVGENLTGALDGWGGAGRHTGVLVTGGALAGALFASLVAGCRGPVTQGLVLLLSGAALGGGVHHLVSGSGMPAEVIAGIGGSLLLGAGALGWSRGCSLRMGDRYGPGGAVRMVACGSALVVGCCVEEILDVTPAVSTSRALVLAGALLSLTLVTVAGPMQAVAPWALLVLSRPAGLGLGSWLSDGAGGLGLGPALSSGLLLAGIAVSVSHLCMQERPARPIPAPRREPELPAVAPPDRRPDLQPSGAPRPT